MVFLNKTIKLRPDLAIMRARTSDWIHGQPESRRSLPARYVLEYPTVNDDLQRAPLRELAQPRHALANSRSRCARGTSSSSGSRLDTYPRGRARIARGNSTLPQARRSAVSLLSGPCANACAGRDSARNGARPSCDCEFIDCWSNDARSRFVSTSWNLPAGDTDRVPVPTCGWCSLGLSTSWYAQCRTLHYW